MHLGLPSVPGTPNTVSACFPAMAIRRYQPDGRDVPALFLIAGRRPGITVSAEPTQKSSY